GARDPPAARRADPVRAVARDVAASGAKALRRARARDGAQPRVRDGVRPAAARAVDVGDARACREDRARAIEDADPRRAPHRGRARRGNAMTCASAVKHAAPAPELPRFRAPIVFGFLLLLFLVLIGRSLYLQWI